MVNDPVPYTVRGDDLLTLLLLLSIVVLVVSMSELAPFIKHQLRRLLYSGNNKSISETAVELRFQLFLLAQSCILLSITTYQYASRYHLADIFSSRANVFGGSSHSEQVMMGIFFMVFVGYYLFKALLYCLVNTTFFSMRLNTVWLKTWLFLSAMQGVLLLPLILLTVYMGFPLKNAQFCFAFIIISIKLLAFYKYNGIFFRQNVVGVQNILYLCTLEIVPMLLLIDGLQELMEHFEQTL